MPVFGGTGQYERQDVDQISLDDGLEQVAGETEFRDGLALVVLAR